MKTIKNILMIALIFTGLVFSGCGKSGSGSPVVSDLTGESATKIIEAADGGSISCTASDGVEVTLTIPAKALNESTEVTLTVETASETANVEPETFYKIKTEPENLMLSGTAYLQVELSESLTALPDISLGYLKDDGFLLPLKQKRITNTITGNLYRFGTFDCSEFNTDLGNDIADKIQTAETPDTWQDLFTIINGLIRVNNYLQQAGEIDNAKACLNAVLKLSVNGIDSFIQNQVSASEKETTEYKTSLAKYKFIQRLCSDQAIDIL